ncbi:YrhK family protein [Thiohalorhabdus methylotrophus]|uniref:YrhK family protein n=1 Tax=Thiohalorhabdus methylotrophus TaxID=3242694 RepID=A0ABV4U077_9GAMM
MTREHIERVDRNDGDEQLVIRMGREELIIRQRYQAASILNDFLIGLWFLLGSIAFFWHTWQDTGIWLFVLGSAQLLVRPMIRLAHQVHLRSMPPERWDF